MLHLKFGFYRKTQPAQAKEALTHGVIETLEGPVRFAPGDYLMRGIDGEEWVIKYDVFPRLYSTAPLTEDDADGYAYYVPKGIKRAVQVMADFVLEDAQGLTLTGKAGDYIAVNDAAVHVTGQSIFERTYEEIPPSLLRHLEGNAQ
jgi:hypothetical protein